MKKYFLSSMLLMGLMAPAFGADGKITGGAGTCTVDVLGVYDNNATANTIATWALNDYKCGAGQYLDEDTLACITCPAGSYCPGGTYTVENADEGTNACPTGYKNSDTGASADTQCYTDCKVSDIAHATAVTGNDYYGTGTDTCVVTNCELGYQVDEHIEVYEKTPLIPVDYHERHIGSACIEANGENSNSTTLTVADAGLTEKNTWARSYDNGLVYGRASCQPQRAGDGYTIAMVTLFWALGEMTMDEAYLVMKNEYGTLKADSWKYMMEQVLAENITPQEFQNWLSALFTINKEADYNTTDVGTQCWCQITDFMPTNGDKTAIISAPWVWDGNFQSESSCEDSCAYVCAEFSLTYEESEIAASAALYGALDYRMTGGMCKITENNCPAGQYLAIVGDAMMCVPCKSGSYCPGGVYTIESEYKGTNVCPSGYPNSDAGAGADTQCYTACTLETANIAHATKVSGNDYYGNGTDTCSATECVKGYHTDSSVTIIEKTPAVSIDPDTINGVAVIDGTGFSFNENLSNSGLTENNTIAVSFSNGILYGRASCQPTVDTGMEYIIGNTEAVINGTMTIEEFRAGAEPLVGTAKTDFAVEYINAMQSGGDETEWANKIFAVFMTEKNTNYSTSSTGTYCYVQANAFAPNGGTKSDIIGAPWVLFPAPFESDEECASNCILAGTGVVLELPDVAFGALAYVETSICAANTINIDWNPDNGGAHTQNMCVYDGAITLPTPDPVKPGYVFSGWKLVE